MKNEIIEKESKLKEIIKNFGSVAVAYSGGVDSTYLAEIVHQCLGNNAHMIIADSPSIPRSEMDFAIKIAKDRNWNINVINTGEFEIDEFLSNDRKRCYYCKVELFKQISKYAKDNNISTIAYGEIKDDENDYRPGQIAAGECGVRAPLREVGLYKNEIRVLSKEHGLPTHAKASFACLSSRVPTGSKITKEAIKRIEQAEEFLKNNYRLSQYRVRHHGDICRIEVDKNDIPKIVEDDMRKKIIAEFKTLGWKYVTLDIEGYRMGSSS